MLEVAVQVEESWPADDWDTLAATAVRAALAASPRGDFLESPACIEVSVRLTDDDEVRRLNASYCDKDKPTNVLSFPLVQPDLLDGLAETDDGEILLGDIVLAHGVCAAEAAEMGITLQDHATHLIVHGLLHLLGYDHQGPGNAEVMERIERDVLGSLGLADPYADHDQGV